MANEDEIFQLNTLNKMQDRAVRGAKPGMRNTVKCGRVYVEAPTAGATGPIKEYLVQGTLDSNLIEGSATFTVGSKTVTGFAYPFTLLVAGDTIRREGDHTKFVIAGVINHSFLTLDRAVTTTSTQSFHVLDTVSQTWVLSGIADGVAGSPVLSVHGMLPVVNYVDCYVTFDVLNHYIVRKQANQSLTLTQAYASDNGEATGTELTGPFSAYKVIFGSAVFDTVENTKGTSGVTRFSYSQSSATWEEAPGAHHTYPRLTGDTVAIQDGVTLHFIGKDNPPTPDIQTIGTVVDKGISVQHEGLPFLSMPVVPYPGDHSTLHVSRQLPGESSYSPQAYGSDYFVDYNQQPVYSPDQPPYSLRRQASLVPAVGFLGALPLDRGYRGAWAVTADSERITGIVSGSEVLEAGDLPETEYVVVSAASAASKTALLSAGCSGTPSVRIAGGSPVPGVTASGRLLDWSASTAHISTGQTLQVDYWPVPGSYVPTPAGNVLAGKRRLYPYLDYLLDPTTGYLTTVTAKTGAARTMQYLSLSPQQVTDKSAPLFGAPLGDLVVNAYHGSALSPGVDYKVEGSRISWDGLPESNIGKGTNDGLRLFYEISSGEFPVKYILYPDTYFSNGLDAYRMAGGFSDAEAVDIATVGTQLVRDTDYSVNEKNGTFRFSPELLSTDVVGFRYQVKGNPITGEELLGYRTARYPVIEGSLLVRGRSLSSSKILTEGTDYSFSYMTGVLTLLPGVVWEKYFVEYTPVAKLSCLVKKVDGQGSYQMRMEGEPAVVTSQGTIQFYNPNIAPDTVDADGKTVSSVSGVKDITVYDRSGVVIPLAGASFAHTAKLLTFTPNTSLSAGQVLPVSYTYTDKVLPFAPLVTIPKTLAKGQDWFLTDGSTKAKDAFKAGSVLLVAPRGGYTRYYHMILSNEDAGDGVNNRITVSGSFADTFRDPSFMVSNDGLVFNTPNDAVAAPIAKGATQVSITGDVTADFLPGRLLRIATSSKDEVYRITHATSDGSTTAVAIDPPALSSETDATVLGTLKVSDSVVYVEGDNAIVTQYPIYAEHPLWKLHYAPVDGYAEAQVGDTTIDIVEHGSDGVVKYSVARSEYAVDVVSAIESLGGGGKFQVEWLFTRMTDFRTSYVVSDNFLQRMPKTVMTQTQVLRQRSTESALTPLKYGSSAGQGDFHVESGIIVLEAPILRGDLYSVGYLGVDLKRDHYGSSLYLSGRKISPQPVGTQYLVTSDYRLPDQYYVQALTDESFYKGVIQPYLDSLEARSEGAQPMGAEGPGTSTPGNDAGGLQDNWFLLRDAGVSMDLLHRIHDYYLGRMTTFAGELSASTGRRLGALDFSLPQSDAGFDLATYHDVAQAAVFGASKVYPVGYAGVSPKADPRFAGQYTSYGKANFFNYDFGTSGIHGVAYGDNTLFVSRGFVPGDSVRVSGTAAWYTVQAVVSEHEMRFSAALAGLAPSPYAYAHGVYSFGGSSIATDVVGYEVKKAVPDAFPYYDAEGNICAVAVGAVAEPFGLTPGASDHNKLTILYYASEASASTPFTITADLSSLSAPYTAEKVAEALMTATWSDTGGRSYAGLGSWFKVEARQSYVANGVDVEVALSYAWPLTITDKGSGSGFGNVLVLRAKVPGAYFGFSGVAAQTLGFRTSPVYSGAIEVRSACASAVLEGAASTSARAVLNLADLSPDRLGWGGAAYADPIRVQVRKAIDSASNEQTALASSKARALELTREVGASSAIAATYAGATGMLPVYDSLLGQVSSVLEDYYTLLGKLGDPDAYGAYICGLEFQEQAQEDLRADLKDNLEGHAEYGGLPYVTVSSSASYSPHVAYGDKSQGARLFGYGVFPFYPSTGAQLPGAWNAAGSNVVPLMRIYATDSDSLANILSLSFTNSTLKISPEAEAAIEVPLSAYPTLGALREYLQEALGPYGYSVLLLDGAGVTITSGAKYDSVAATRSSLLDQTLGFTESDTPLTAKYKHYDLQSSPIGCFSGNSALFSVDAAISLSSYMSVPHSELSYEVTDEDLILHWSYFTGGQSTFHFADYGTVQELADAINAHQTPVRGFVAAASESRKDYRYGLLARRGLTVLDDGTTNRNKLFLGIKTDVRTAIVSDKNLAELEMQMGAREGEAGAMFGVLQTRGAAIRANFAAELVAGNKELWFSRLANRQDGPCVKTLNLKKQLLKK